MKRLPCCSVTLQCHISLYQPGKSSTTPHYTSSVILHPCHSVLMFYAEVCDCAVCVCVLDSHVSTVMWHGPAKSCFLLAHYKKKYCTCLQVMQPPTNLERNRYREGDNVSEWGIKVVFLIEILLIFIWKPKHLIQKLWVLICYYSSLQYTLPF